MKTKHADMLSKASYLRTDTRPHIVSFILAPFHSPPFVSAAINIETSTTFLGNSPDRSEIGSRTRSETLKRSSARSSTASTSARHSPHVTLARSQTPLNPKEMSQWVSKDLRNLLTTLHNPYQLILLVPHLLISPVLRRRSTETEPTMS